MRSNIPPGADVVVVDKSVEMALYDALPERWKRLVNGLPIQQRIGTIQQYRDRLGDEAGYKVVVDIFTQKFPGWVPPERDEELAETIRPRAPLLGRRRRGEIVVPDFTNKG